MRVDHYLLRMRPQRLDVREAGDAAVDATLRCEPDAFRALLMGTSTLDAALEQGGVRLEGSRRVVTAWARAVGIATR